MFSPSDYFTRENSQPTGCRRSVSSPSGLRAMSTRCIPVLGSVRALFLCVPSSFVRVYVLRKTRRRRLLMDGIRFSRLSSRPGGVSSIVGEGMEVCLWRICPWWINSDLVVVSLPWCVFRLDHSDLRYSSSAVVVVLLHWSYEALAR